MSRLLLVAALLLSASQAQAATLETMYGRQECAEGLLGCSGDYETAASLAAQDWAIESTGWDPAAYDADCAGPCEYLELEDTL